jgi:hypothetical protein
MTIPTDAVLLIGACIVFFILFFKLGEAKITQKLAGSILAGIGIDMAAPPYPTSDLPFFIIYLLQKNIIDLNILINNLFNLNFYAQFVNLLIQNGFYSEYILIIIVIGSVFIAAGVILSGISLSTLARSFARDIKGRLSLFAILFVVFISLITLAKVSNYYYIDGTPQLTKEFFVIAIMMSIFAASIVLLILLLTEQIFNIKTEKITRMVGM